MVCAVSAPLAAANVTPGQKKHGFSPCTRPFYPVGQSPSSMPLECGSAHSTPVCMASPALSTPGCNPVAKPFLPACQRLSLNALGQSCAKGAISMREMLDVKRHIAQEEEEPLPFTAAASDLSDILSVSAGSSASWLSEVCRTLETSAAQQFPLLDDVESASTPSHDSAEELRAASGPLTSMAFMKSMKPRKAKGAGRKAA